MRERAAAVGGTVEAGTGAAGGFRVAARLPLGGRLADQPLGPAADQPAADPAAQAQEGTP
jgi:signal transduction histidine kinase